jgi:hypothetical protein
MRYLGPDEVIQVGDEWSCCQFCLPNPVAESDRDIIGMTVSQLKSIFMPAMSTSYVRRKEQYVVL